MKRREPPACTEMGRVRRKRAKPSSAAGVSFVAPASFASMSPVKQAVKISPKRGGRASRHAIQSPVRFPGAKDDQKSDLENRLEPAGATFQAPSGSCALQEASQEQQQQQPPQPEGATKAGGISGSEARNISTVLHPPFSTLENFVSGSFQPVRPRQRAPATSPAPATGFDERAFDRMAMEVLLGRASTAVGAPFTFVSPSIALGIPAGTVRGQGIGKAEEVVGVPWGERASERRISHEAWCREFYWRLVLHQVAKKAGMSREELGRLVGRTSESVLKLVGSGAIRRHRTSGRSRNGDSGSKDERSAGERGFEENL